jgi:NADH dehydrogenase FAD-containing subunit
VMRRVARALQARGIEVLAQSCTAIAADHVLLADGSRLACNAPVLATGVSAPRWLAGSGLALDERGFIATGATLQSTSHAEVFAVGDVASRTDAPHPKSGVYAVRAGPPLAQNLRRLLGAEPLQPHLPQRRTLNLVSCGDHHAIASWGGLSAEGGWVWRWKDHIDRAFITRYSGLKADLTPAGGS